MIYCKNCKKEVEPVFKSDRWRCPICNKFIAMSEEREKPPILESIPVKGMGISKSIKLSPIDIEMAELLIEDGVANDFSDLIKKGVNLLFNTTKKGFDEQFKDIKLNKDPNPERTLKQIQEQEMIKTYIDMIKNNNSNNNKFDPLSAMMMFKMMEEDKDKGRITITIK